MRLEEGWQWLEVGSGVVGSGDIEMQAPFQKPGGSEDAREGRGVGGVGGACGEGADVGKVCVLRGGVDGIVGTGVVLLATGGATLGTKVTRLVGAGEAGGLWGTKACEG